MNRNSLTLIPAQTTTCATLVFATLLRDRARTSLTLCSQAPILNSHCCCQQYKRTPVELAALHASQTRPHHSKQLSTQRLGQYVTQHHTGTHILHLEVTCSHTLSHAFLSHLHVLVSPCASAYSHQRYGGLVVLAEDGPLPSLIVG